MAEEVEGAISEDAGSEGTEVVEGEVQPLIFGKFKDISEAEKSYREAEKKISQQGQELSAREARLRDLEEKSNLAKLIETVAAARKQESNPGVDFEKFVATIGEEMQQNPTEAVKKLMNANGAWLNESESRVKKHSDDKVSSLEQKLALVLDKLEKMDPTYQKDKDIIEELVEGGMSLDKAKAFVSKLDKPDAPVQRARPPMTPSGGAKPAGGMPVFLTAKDKAECKAEGMTEKEIQELESEYRTNYLRELEEKKERS